MSLRFSSLTAMRSALGQHARLRDSFPENKTVRPRAGRRSGATPHDILWAAVSSCLADAVREFENAVPGRKYRLDIAIPAARLAIEVDGWEWHGKHKGDFLRDRERQNLLTLHGWRILRFAAGQIRKDTAGCVEQIRLAATHGESNG